MERLFILDAKDYDEGMPEISRTAVRAVISIGDELLCIEDKTGGVKLPGGGQEDGEDDLLPDPDAPAPVGIPAAPNFAAGDSQGDLANRQKKFGMMMKPFSI